VHHSGPRDKGVKERSRMEKRKRVEPHGRPITLAVLVLLDACTNVLCFADWLSDNSSPSAKTKRRCLSTRSCRSDVGHFAENPLRPCCRLLYEVDDFSWSTTSTSRISDEHACSTIVARVTCQSSLSTLEVNRLSSITMLTSRRHISYYHTNRQTPARHTLNDLSVV